jgi:hypothetical protein
MEQLGLYVQEASENWLKLPGRFGTIPQGGFAVERFLAQRRPNKALNPSGGSGGF